MALIVEIQNPFNPLEDTCKHEFSGGLSVYDWLRKTYPGFKEFTHPTICLFNGQPLLRRYWKDRVIQAEDTVNFVVMPRGIDPITLAIYVFVAVLIASVVLYLTMPKPKALSAGDLEPDPVYTLQGQRNQNRLTNPIEVPYGSCRLFPSYAARAYNKFINNEQYQYQLFCVGQGHYDISEILIEDTPIGNFQDVTYAIYQPGEQVLLFPNNVITSVEVSGIEMFGPNEAEYDGVIGGFVANPSFTLASVLEVDITLPQGLYHSNDAGGLDDLTITATFEYRAINDAGAPLGGWILLFNFSKTLKTNTPQRFTLEAEVAQGRYEVRGVRTNNKDTDSRSANTLQWAALRAFLPSTKNYGDVTMLAVKARATNNLNDRASNRINCRAVRKLRSWNKTTQTWNAIAATRSIVWAFCDLMTADYGGKLPDSRLDLDGLYDLDVILNARNDYFDFVFDQRSTVWESARTIARCGRCLPIINGSRVSLIRDDVKTLPTAVFNQENIVKDSFKWELKLPNTDDKDSIEVEYIESTTWKPETVICTLPGGTSNNPEQLKLLGCTDRARAYREGLYIRAQDKYLRENVTFRTGLEGHIPSYGDLISISHDLPRWGSAGLILSVAGTVLTLSEPVTFTTGNHWIVARKKDGTQAGPFAAIAGVDAYHVVVSGGIGDNYFFDDYNERPLFLFGQTDLWGRLLTVVGLTPDEDTVEVRAVVYNPIIYSFDNLTPPPLSNPTLPPVVPALPVVENFEVSYIPDTIQQVMLSWSPALGAQSYLIQKSFNGADWESVDRTQITSYRLSVTPGTLYVRVAGINLAAGPWTTWTGTVGAAETLPGAVTGLSLQSPFVGTFVRIQWNAVLIAQGYTVKVYQDAGATLKRTVSVTDLTYSYSVEDATTDGSPKRSMRFSVTPFNNIGPAGSASTLDVSNPVPPALTGLSITYSSETADAVTYIAAWTASTDVDVNRYRLYGSLTSGFTPGAGNLLYEGGLATIAFSVTKVSGAHAPFYWRAAALDVWGNEFNASAEQTIFYANQLTDGSGNNLTDGSGNLLRG